MHCMIMRLRPTKSANIEVGTLVNMKLTCLHVINDWGIVSDSLIIHAPSTSCKDKLTSLNKLPRHVSHELIFVLPPSPKETSLNLDKSFVWIICQLFDNWFDDVLNSSSLDTLLDIFMWLRLIYISDYLTKVEQ